MKEFPAHENRILLRYSLFLFILIFLIYFRTLNAPFLFDDYSKIADNPDIKNLRTIHEKLIFRYSGIKDFRRNDPSRPVVYLTYAVNFWLSGLNTFSYHLVNICIHFINALLLCFFFIRIGAASDLQDSMHFTGPAMVCSVLFAVHPVNTSCVSYLFNRSDLLSTLFYLSGLLFFAKYAERGGFWCVPSLMAYVLGIFSKQNAVTLPAVIFMFDFLILSKCDMKPVQRRKYIHAAFWLCFLLYLLFRILYWGGIGDLEAQKAKPVFEYLVLVPYCLARYFLTLVFPLVLCIDHDLLPQTVSPVLQGISFVLMMAAVIFIVSGLWVKKMRAREANFFLLWFFIVLSPTTSFLPTTTYIADNRLYLAGISWTGLIFFMLLRKSFAGWRPYGKAIAVYALVFIVLTVLRNEKYREPYLLWKEVTELYPANANAHLNYGFELFRKGLLEDAMNSYRKSLELHSGNAQLRINIGLVYLKTGKTGLAQKEFLAAIELNGSNDLAWNNLGYVRSLNNEAEEAERCYRKAILLNPKNTLPYNNLSNLYFERKEYALAISLLRRSLELNPYQLDLYVRLGESLFHRGEYDPCLTVMHQALALKQESRMYLLAGRCYAEMGHREKMKNALMKVLEMDPGNAEAAELIKAVP